MNYWIFTVTEHKDVGLRAQDIFNQRMNDGFWGLGERTPNRKNLEQGDRVVYYLGNPNMVFAGTATLKTSSYELSDDHKKRYGHNVPFYISDYGVELSDMDVWAKPKSVVDLVPILSFIDNKEFWFSYFQGGVRQIAEEDYKAIIGERYVSLVEQITSAKDIESQAEFALEAHLEEFIYQNWSSIKWGSRLELYKTDEANGRQFPAGTWSIDFLAVDRDKGDIVVIELKRGKTSDSTVGQILRYINWIKDNIAKSGQSVRGIIIAKEVDEALKYAVKNSDIIIKTYKVDFQLIDK